MFHTPHSWGWEDCDASHNQYMRARCPSDLHSQDRSSAAGDVGVAGKRNGKNTLEPVMRTNPYLGGAVAPLSAVDATADHVVVAGNKSSSFVGAQSAEKPEIAFKTVTVEKASAPNSKQTAQKVMAPNSKLKTTAPPTSAAPVEDDDSAEENPSGEKKKVFFTSVSYSL